MSSAASPTSHSATVDRISDIAQPSHIAAFGVPRLKSSSSLSRGLFAVQRRIKIARSVTCSPCKSCTGNTMKKPTSHLRRYIPAALPPPDCSGNTFLFSGCCFLHSRSTSRKGLPPRKNPASDLHTRTGFCGRTRARRAQMSPEPSPINKKSKTADLGNTKEEKIEVCSEKLVVESISNTNEEESESDVVDPGRAVIEPMIEVKHV
ncbi:hypothetical protein L1887_42409 [Cichorium endivia]|nr:hypothetical protein L1887_42409 [Cichorium endivia]